MMCLTNRLILLASKLKVYLSGCLFVYTQIHKWFDYKGCTTDKLPCVMAQSSFNSTNPVDPLKLLRSAYQTRETDRNPFNYCSSSGEVLEKLEEACTHITVLTSEASCPFLIFPRSVSTNYRSKRGSGPYYPLDSVCFLLERRDDSYTNYLQDARRFGVMIVSLPDKRDLLDYLTAGDAKEEYAAVDTAAEIPTPLMLFPDSAEAVREKEELMATSSNKRPSEPSTTTTRKPKQNTESTTTESRSSPKPPSNLLDTALFRPVESTESIFQSNRVISTHCEFKFLLFVGFFLVEFVCEKSSRDTYNNNNNNNFKGPTVFFPVRPNQFNQHGYLYGQVCPSKTDSLDYNFTRRLYGPVDPSQCT
jgi:hypothetical protein